MNEDFLTTFKARKSSLQDKYLENESQLMLSYIIITIEQQIYQRNDKNCMYF